MMTGIVREMQLVLPVVFVLADGSQVTRELVVDTGFTGGLSLPLEMVQELSLVFLHDFGATLADGTEGKYPLYSSVIQWHSEEKNVAAFALGDRPLLGTALLEGNDLFARFKENENFTLKES